MKAKTKKRITAGVAAVSAMALLLAGTYAWRDYTQHSTNVFDAVQGPPQVRLNDKFTPPENWNMRTAANVDKKVSVTNTAVDGRSVLVRLRFSEFFLPYTISYEERMKDPENATKILLVATYAEGEKIGQYVMADSKAELEAELAKLGLSSLQPVEVDISSTSTANKKWFAKTKNEELQNGIYGKSMYDPKKAEESKTQGNQYGDPTIPRIPRSSTDEHNFHVGNKSEYMVHKWNETSITNAEYPNDTDPNKSWYAPINSEDFSKISDFIEWKLGDNVIKFSDWVAQGELTDERWILDEETGWCYWGSLLEPGITTSNIMERVHLKKMPSDEIDYEIHVDMESITVDELENEWVTIPPSLKNVYKSDQSKETIRQRIRELIVAISKLDKAQYTDESWAKLIKEEKAARVLVNKPASEVSKKELEIQRDSLEDAFLTLLLKKDKDRLQNVIIEKGNLTREGWTPLTWAEYQRVVQESKQVFGNPSATHEQVNYMIEDLNTAYERLRVSELHIKKLQDLVDEVKSFDHSAISEAAWKATERYLTEAEKLLKEKDLKANKINEAWVNLHIAFLGHLPINTVFESLNGMEWRLVEKTDTKLIIISQHIVENLPHREDPDSLTAKDTGEWSKSSLKNRINGSVFMGKYFTQAELNKIVPIARTYTVAGTIKQLDNEKINILSREDFQKYFNAGQVKVMRENQGVGVATKWWLKDSGGFFGEGSSHLGRYYYVDEQGKIKDGIRPGVELGVVPIYAVNRM